MSRASISYRSLTNAASEAKGVARKLDRYADNLQRDVYNKLNNYDGSWSSNISTAKSYTNSKINELRTEQKDYENYASDLIDLRDECRTVDKAVRSKVSSLTASFKKNHGIRNSKVQNTVNYILTSVRNKNAKGRWLNTQRDEFKIKRDYLKDSIKEWYNYGGGKELIKGYLTVLLDIGIAVAGAIAAIATFMAATLTAGAVIVLAAALVTSAIALQDAWANWQNEKAAYNARQNDDPATGKRRSDIDSYSDYLRSSYMFGDDGQTYHYNKVYNGIAFGLDVATFVSGIVSLVSGCGKLLKNGYKCLVGKEAKGFKEIFSKNGLSKMFNGIKNHFSKGLSNLGKAIQKKDLEFFKVAFKDFGSDFLSNLKNEFLNFEGKNPLEAIGNGASSIKNLYGYYGSVVNNGFGSWETIKRIVLPGVGLGHIPGADGMIVANDIYSIGEGIGSIISKDDNPLINDNLVKKDVLEKLSSLSTIDISIPDINVPKISLGRIYV